MADDPAAQIRARALAEGFDAVGFAPATLGSEALEHLTRFVEAGRHGDMGWLAERAEQRSHPQALWSDARSVVVLGLNYAPAYDPLSVLQDRTGGVISAYAQGRDYHDVVKKKLRVVARWMAERFKVEVKLFVDTAPVMEKPLAQSAGLGWQGRHTNLVSREFGSWLFLGEIYTTLDLAPDPAEVDHCGSCRACLEICPTSAFPAPYQLDARRCISYLTIEHKGPIARELRPLIGNRIYGCDDCLAVCPWNKFARPTEVEAFRGTGLPDRLRELAGLDDAAFRLRFSGSPVKRIGRDRFIRNVLIAVGNAADPALAACAESLLSDPSPLVRGAAVWALSRLVPARLAALKAQHASAESDSAVLLEWQECVDDAAQNRSVC